LAIPKLYNNERSVEVMHACKQNLSISTTITLTHRIFCRTAKGLKVEEGKLFVTYQDIYVTFVSLLEK